MLPHPLRHRDFLIAWFLYAICTVIAGALLGGLLGGILGAIGLSPVTDRAYFLVICGGGGLVASYFLFRAFVSVFIVRKLMEARSDR
jgi:hypothetical protein